MILKIGRHDSPHSSLVERLPSKQKVAGSIPAVGNLSFCNSRLRELGVILVHTPTRPLYLQDLQIVDWIFFSCRTSLASEILYWKAWNAWFDQICQRPID